MQYNEFVINCLKIKDISFSFCVVFILWVIFKTVSTLHIEYILVAFRDISPDPQD